MDQWGLLDDIIDEYVIIPSIDSPFSPYEEDGSSRQPSEPCYGKHFTEAIRCALSNPNFNKEDFKTRKMMLCQSYYLLWHQSVAGNIESLHANEKLKYGIHAAILLDLFALGKIKFIEKTHFKFSNDLLVEVIDDEPTFTFIDTILFQKIVKQSKSSSRHHQRCRSTLEWLKYSKHTDSVGATLRNLKHRGILSMSNSIFSSSGSRARAHSLLNYGPAKCLERDIKAVGLNKRKPDTFMLSLLTLLTVEKDSTDSIDDILERRFSHKEYRVAKENICVMVNSQGAVLRSPKFKLKRFSSDFGSP